MAEPETAPALTEAERAAILDAAVEPYVLRGCRVVSRTVTTAQLVYPKVFSPGWAVLWLLVGGVGLLVYVSYYLAKRDATVHLAVDAAGRVESHTGGRIPSAPARSALVTCPICGHRNGRARTACENCRRWLGRRYGAPAPEVDPVGRELRMPERGPVRRAAAFVMVTGFTFPLLLALAAAVVGDGSPGTAQVPVGAAAPPPTAAPTPARSGEVNVDLGTRPPTFGSQGQAAELLNLIRQHPGKAGYSISYRAGAEAVVVGCDLAKNVVVRVYEQPGHRGTSEMWSGHAVERLRSAAAGGSLNDTPAGDVPGSFQRF